MPKAVFAVALKFPLVSCFLLFVPFWLKIVLQILIKKNVPVNQYVPKTLLKKNT